MNIFNIFKHKWQLYPKHWIVTSKTRQRLWDGKFLPVPRYYEKTASVQIWSTGSDKEERFKENLKKKPKNWYYRTHDVKYTYNSEGYRTREFKDIEWEKSIVLFGCSHVMGDGLDDAHTISSTIERLTGIPTINMGVCGASVDYVMTNQIILRNFKPRPRAVVVFWPCLDRATWFHQDTIEHLMPWDTKWNPNQTNNLILALNEDKYHQVIRGNISRMISKSLWDHDGLYYDCTTNLIDAEALRYCDFVGRDHKARDCSHPGKEWTLKIANHLIKKLELPIV